MDKQAVFDWVKQQYGTEPDYPWHDRKAVLRHKANNKWYAAVMEISRDKLGLNGDGMVDIINVKCDPVLIGSLRMQQGFHPAYHMNKEKWVTIRLDGSVAMAEITELIGLSYDLTGPGKKKK